jgi:hypothetical protein
MGKRIFTQIYFAMEGARLLFRAVPGGVGMEILMERREC